MKLIETVATELGLSSSDLIPYGSYKAKISLSGIRKERTGKMIVVTGITPTPAGEGKTTTVVGLAQGMGKLGKNVVATLNMFFGIGALFSVLLLIYIDLIYFREVMRCLFLAPAIIIGIMLGRHNIVKNYVNKNLKKIVLIVCFISALIVPAKDSVKQALLSEGKSLSEDETMLWIVSLLSMSIHL